MNPPIDLKAIWEEALLKEGQRFTAASNNASRLGHPCVRHLVYARTVQPPPFDLGSMKRIKEGIIQEQYVRDWLKLLGRSNGFEVIQDSVPVEMNKYQIKGKIDGLFVIDGKKYPYEIKTSSANVFRGMNTIDDFQKKWYHRGYLAQLNIYLLSKGEEELGAIVLKNRECWEPEVFWINLDYDWAEEMLQKAETINKHLAEGTLPDRMVYNPNVCSMCDYQTTCLPDIDFGPEAKLMANPELEADLDRHAEIQKIGKEYKSLDDKVKKLIKKEGAPPNALIGNHQINCEEKDRKGYTVEPGKSTHVHINHLGIKEGERD